MNLVESRDCTPGNSGRLDKDIPTLAHHLARDVVDDVGLLLVGRGNQHLSPSVVEREQGQDRFMNLCPVVDATARQNDPHFRHYLYLLSAGRTARRP